LGGNPGTDSDWKTYTTITDNSEGMRSHYLNHISTEGIRLKINGSNGSNDYSRVIEFEAYEDTGIAGKVNTYLTSLTDADEGMIAYIEDSLNSQGNKGGKFKKRIYPDGNIFISNSNSESMVNPADNSIKC